MSSFSARHINTYKTFFSVSRIKYKALLPSAQQSNLLTFESLQLKQEAEIIVLDGSTFPWTLTPLHNRLLPSAIS